MRASVGAGSEFLTIEAPGLTRTQVDLGSFDPATEAFCFLFNPRTQAWNVHFFQKPDYEIEGLTPEGRTTARLLKFNTSERIAERQRLAQ